MVRLLLTITISLFAVNAFAEVDNSCDCPAVKCANPCEEPSGVTFYTEKCEGGKKVKSCAKPTCVPMFTPDNACMAFKKGKTPRDIASVDENKNKKEEYVKPKEKIANVHVVSGEVWVHDYKGIKHQAKPGMNLHETDVIKTGQDGSLKLKFIDGNEVNILPRTELRLTMVQPEDKNKKTVLDLIKGKVRNKVHQKYKQGDNSYYRVRTRAAVAGVRGTDFIVSYEVDSKAVTKIQTLKGEVELNDKSFSQKQAIKAGQEGSFVIASNDEGVFNESEIDDFIARGYMTPVYKMTANEIKNLDSQTRVNANKAFERAIASQKKKSYVCKKPKAELNHCAWTCQNNPDGEKRCRTDLPNVQCVRMRCNANGDWADEHRLPASFYNECDPQGVKVAPCNY